MAKILITSNGISKRNEVVDNLFTDYCNAKKVCVIANAANINSNNFVNREVVKRNLIGVGATAVDVVNLNIVTVNALSKYDVLYIMGGKLEDLVRAFREVNTRDVFSPFSKYVIVSSGASSKLSISTYSPSAILVIMLLVCSKL